MGLDSYLYLKDKDTGEYIEYAYYRKFNALQGYFVEHFNINNPGTVEITEAVINDLYLKLNEIRFQPEKANLLLPTYPGPFFGRVEYDRMYHSYIHQAANDFYHAKFLDYQKYKLFYSSDWWTCLSKLS